ncbi:MAG: hypothetical protein ACK40G_06625 [Cytophagaceae bacterium]
MKTYFPNLILILLCILSRVISSIYYIEDPDSLRFALSILNYDITNFQPHFPGYPVFVFLVKGLYIITGNFSIAFSIIGGFAVFLIIYFLNKLLKVPLASLEGFLVALFVFFNPMIWLMSNRYMPDLTGLAVALGAFYYLVPDHYKIMQVNKGWFLTGLLAGVRLSYAPFLIIPCLYAYFSNKKFLSPILYLCLGIIIWMVPLILFTGWNDLIAAAQKQTYGHFYDFGGTIFTESDTWVRFVSLVRAIWADALGGYWIDRFPFTLINSIGIILCSFFGLMIILSFDYPKSKLYVTVGSIFLYTLWVFFFQNIIYNSRHILPLVPFFLVLIAYGVIYFLVNFNSLVTKGVIAVFMLSTIIITLYLVGQHKKPTAIAQVKPYLESIKNGDELHIVSIPLINYYLEGQKVKAFYYDIYTDMSKIEKINSGKIVVIGNFPNLFPGKPKNVTTFYHNPYVNRIWSSITVYLY